MTKQHRSTATAKMLKSLEKKGFIISDKSKRGTIKIIPPIEVGGPIYHSHCTESSLHYLKRDIYKLYNVTI